MRFARIFLVLLCVMACLVTHAWARRDLQGTLTAEISEDRQAIHIVYTVRNLSGILIPPDPKETYHYSIRNCITGREFIQGYLDSAFQASISQYVCPYGQAVFAIKRIPIPYDMRRNPGFYLIFLTVGPISNGEETVFYLPSDVEAPNTVIRQILSTVNQILKILSPNQVISQ